MHALPSSSVFRAFGLIINLIIALATAAFMTLPLQITPAHAQQPASVAIVMDGSGSMWGKLPGSDQVKFAAAADRLLAHLATVPVTTQVGAILFGQRSRGGCGEARTLKPLAPYDQAEMAAAFKLLNPQGRGPLVLGLRRAAEMLGPAKGPRHVILVHDDPDNCSQDVCAAAREIKQAYPNLRTHAVSLTPKPQNRGALACLTQITGGRIIEVNNISQADAAIANIVRYAALSGRGTGESQTASNAPGEKNAAQSGQQQEVQTRPPSPEPARAPTPGLMLSAALKAGDRVIEDGLFWSIGRLEGDNVTPQHKTSKSRPSIALAPGRYRVELRANGYTRTADIDVKEGPRTLLRMDLDAAAVSLSATLNERGTVVGDAAFAVTAAGGDAAPVWSGLAPRSPLILSAGNYTITTTAGRVTRRRDIRVEVGQKLKLAVPLQAGYLTVRSRLAGNRKPDGAIVAIEADDPASPDGRRTIVRSIRAEPSFLLPAGTYYATARVGAAEKTEQVAVAAGKVIEKTVIVPRMHLKIVSRYPGRNSNIQDNVRYRVWQLRAPNTPPLVSTEPAPTFKLAPGPYRIESRVGKQNATIVRDFEVTNAATGRLVLVHEAGSVELAVQQHTSAKDIYWEIRNPQGQVIWRSLEAAPQVTLKAGQYSIISEIAGQTSKTPLTVKAGRHFKVELGLN